MKKRLDIILLSLGIGLFLYTILGRVIALQVHHSVGNGVSLWLLVPSFLLSGISGELKGCHKRKAELAPVFFAPESVWPSDEE